MKTTLEQWRMFKAVADAGGFNQASQHVHKSQSTIHHAVQKLEDSLSVALFETRGRKVYLTNAGTTLLRRASFVLDEASKIETLASSLTSGVESELTIAVDHAFPCELVYQAIEAVSSEYALLCINLRETVLSGANEMLDNGLVDLAISPFELPESLNEELCMVPFIAVAAAAHPLAAIDSLSIEHLKQERQIVVRDSGVASNVSRGWLGAEKRWTVDHLRTSVELVAKGLGFAWLPEPLIKQLLISGELTALNLGENSQRRVGFYLNFSDADRLGPASRTFMGAIRRLTLEEPSFGKIE